MINDKVHEEAIKILNQICPSMDDLEDALQIVGAVANNLFHQIDSDSRKTDMENWIKMLRQGEKILSQGENVSPTTTH